MPHSVSRDSLVKYRLERASRRLSHAQMFLERGDYNEAAFAAYYVIFYAMRAALTLTDPQSIRSHRGVIQSFNKHYIKTGIMPTDFGPRIWQAQAAWRSSTYEDLYETPASTAAVQVETARELLHLVEVYLLAGTSVSE